MNAMEISRTGLDVEWRRLEVIAQNLANANSTVDPLGEPYRPLTLITGPKGDFSALLRQGASVDALKGVAIYSIEPQNVAPRRVYDPGHPQADTDGFVTMNGMNHIAEMTAMVKTSRTYEANIVAFNAARQMYSKALDLGRRG